MEPEQRFPRRRQSRQFAQACRLGSIWSDRYFGVLEDASNLIFASAPFIPARYRRRLHTPYLVRYDIRIGNAAQVMVLVRV